MKEPAQYANIVKSCSLCSSSNCKFAYLNNNKEDQPRYKCLDCKKLFTHSPHGSNRPKGKTYTKAPGKAVAHLMRECPQCGAASEQTRFAYNNNGDADQPRYRCLNCKKHFQMRLIRPDDGGEPYLKCTSRIVSSNLQAMVTNPMSQSDGAMIENEDPNEDADLIQHELDVVFCETNEDAQSMDHEQVDGVEEQVQQGPHGMDLAPNNPMIGANVGDQDVMVQNGTNHDINGPIVGNERMGVESKEVTFIEDIESIMGMESVEPTEMEDIESIMAFLPFDDDFILNELLRE